MLWGTHNKTAAMPIMKMQTRAGMPIVTYRLAVKDRPHIKSMLNVQPILFLACLPPACNRNIQNVNRIIKDSLPSPIKKPIAKINNSFDTFSRKSVIPYSIMTFSSGGFWLIWFSLWQIADDNSEIFIGITS